MTGFINADGSALIGGADMTGQGRALRVDVQGNLQIQDWLRTLTLQGGAFMSTTGLLNSATGTNNYPLCVFNPADSGKSIFIYSARASSGTSASNSITVLLKSVATDPAYATAAQITGARAGGATSAIAGHCTFSLTPQTVNTPYMLVEISSSGVELLGQNGGILLPMGSAQGLTLVLQTYTSGLNNMTVRWVEF